MTRVGIAAFALVLALSAPAATGAQQDSWFEANWGVSRMATWTTETLQSVATNLRNELARLGLNAAEWNRWDEAYDANLRQCYENVRVALGERGIRIPGVVLSGSSSASGAAGASGSQGSGSTRGGDTQQIDASKVRGGNTQAMNRPNPGVNSSSLVVPLMVVLSAAQLAECNLRGIGFGDCAVQVGLRTAGGLAAGKVVLVLSQSGNPIVSALATGAGIGAAGIGIGGAVIAATYAAVEGARAGHAEWTAAEAEATLRDQQAQNLQRLTRDKLQALVSSFEDDAAKLRALQDVLYRAADEPEHRREAFAELVDDARVAYTAFTDLNNRLAPAATMCGSAPNNPAGAAVRAEQGAARARAAADRAVALFDNARSMTVPCDPQKVAAARAALTSAHEQVAAASRAETDVRDAVRDAALFYSTVRIARDTAGKASLQIAKLERILASALQASADLRGATEVYRENRNRILTEHARFAASVRALHDAFGPTAPGSVKTTLSYIDGLVPDPSLRTLSDDELRRFVEMTDSEINRITGFIRSAKASATNVNTCAQIADATSAQLQPLLDRLAQEAPRDVQRAGAAARAAQDLPGALDRCTASGPIGQPISWGGAWTIDIGTMNLAPSNDAAARAGLATTSAFGPAIACPATSTVLTGEIAIRPWSWISGGQPVSAPVVACATGDTLVGRFSNQSRLAPQDAAAGFVRAGHFALTLYRDNRNAFLGRWRRWNPFSLDNMGEEAPIGGKRQ